MMLQFSYLLYVTLLVVVFLLGLRWGASNEGLYQIAQKHREIQSLKRDHREFLKEFLEDDKPVCIHTEDGARFKMEECPVCKEAIRKICECDDMAWWKTNSGKDIATLIRGQLQQRRFQVVITVRDLLVMDSPYRNNDGNPEISLGTFDTWEIALDATEKLLGPEYKQQVRVLKIGDSWTPWGHRLFCINRYNQNNLLLNVVDTRVPNPEQDSRTLVEKES